MTSKDIVLEYYKNAEAKYFPDVNEVGQHAPIQKGYWAIYKQRELGAQPLATGPTEDAAWTNAASIVTEKIAKPNRIEISRETIFDSERIKGFSDLPQEIQKFLTDGKQIIIKELDGSESEIELDENGELRVKRSGE